MFISLQFKLELKKEDREKLIKLMQKQSSAIRTAYNMLRELQKEKIRNPLTQIYQKLRQLFPDMPKKKTSPMERQKVFAKAKEGGKIKGGGSVRDKSWLYISYRHAKVCTTVKHR